MTALIFPLCKGKGTRSKCTSQLQEKNTCLLSLMEKMNERDLMDRKLVVVTKKANGDQLDSGPARITDERWMQKCFEGSLREAFCSYRART